MMAARATAEVTSRVRTAAPDVADACAFAAWRNCSCTGSSATISAAAASVHACQVMFWKFTALPVLMSVRKPS